jgi:hypothetical protein
VQIIKVDKALSSAILINNITDAIRTSDFIVVDVSRHNPNVYYELGYAHAYVNSHYIIDANSDTRLPSDLSALNTLFMTQKLSQMAEQ